MRTILAVVCFGLSSATAQNVITTVAGTDYVFDGDGKPASQAQLGRVQSVAVDSANNVYSGDAENHIVYRLSPDGTLTVVAGNGIAGYTGDGGPALQASLGGPFYLAVGPSGDLFIADSLAAVIRRVDQNGIITTFAGSNSGGYMGDGGPALQASFFRLNGLAAGPDGSVYVSDTNRIRKIQTDGSIQLFAGNATTQYAGDGAVATSTGMNALGIAVDGVGNVYIADGTNGRIRKVGLDGTVSTVAGAGNSLRFPTGVALDAAGNLYIADSNAAVIKKVGSDQSIRTIAGSGISGYGGDDGPATSARLGNTLGVTSTASGVVYIADAANLRIRRIGLTGTIQTVGGTGQIEFSGDGGPAIRASFANVDGLAVNQSGVYISDSANNRIRKLTPDGNIQTVAGTGQAGDTGDEGPATQATLLGPGALASDSTGNIYIAEPAVGAARVRKITPDGTIHAAAGKPGGGVPQNFTTPIDALKLQLAFPVSIATSPTGDLYLLDLNIQPSVLRVATNGILTIPPCSSPGQCPPTSRITAIQSNSSSIEIKSQMAVGKDQSVYVSDAGRRLINRVAADGTVTPVVGNGAMFTNPQDGASALSSPIGATSAMTFDAAGNLVFGDDYYVHRLNPDGTITKLAGDNRAAGTNTTGDGGLATSAGFFPGSLQYDADGNLYIADLVNRRIRKVLANPPQISSGPDTLEFAALSGAAPPLPQNVRVSSLVPGIGFSASSDSDWLKLSVGAANTPRLIDVVADPANLTEGDHTATVTITSPTATPASRDIAVTVHVAAALPPRASLDKENFSFAFPKAGKARSETLIVSNTGGGAFKFNVVTETVTGGAWLTTSVAAGTALPTSSAAVTITANPASLPPQTYRGVVRIIPVGSPEIRIPVNMTVSAIDTAIVLSQTGLTFTAVNGGGITPARHFDVINVGLGTVAWSVSTSTLPDGLNWLQVDRTAGTSTAGATPPGVNVSVNASDLDPGVYYGRVQVSAPGAANTPQSLTVFLNVLASGSDPGAVTEPSELLFSMVAGGPSPSSQNFFVYNIAAAPKGYRGSAGFDVLSGRIAILPGDGILDPSQPTRVVVQPIFSSLQKPVPGVYTGSVNLQFDEGRVRSVKVKLIVAAAPSAATAPAQATARGRSTRQAEAGCVPSTLVPSISSLSPSLVLTAGWPVPIEVNVKDDCGGNHTAGSVRVSFSTNDQPIALKSLLDGRWAGTWSVASAARAQATVQVEAKNPDLDITGKSSVTLGLNQPQDQPAFTTAAISSAAGTPAFTPLAPGSLITISGDNLAEVSQDAGAPPLPFKLGNSQVLISGFRAPIVSVTRNQIQAVLPYRLEPNTTHSIVVQRGNTFSRSVPVDVALAQPAIFRSDDGPLGRVYVLGNANPQPVTVANPARRGDTLLIDCAGLGTVTPLPDDGTAVSVPPPAALSNVTVVFGTAEVAADSATLTGGSVGHYQVRVKVPADAVSGSAVQLQIKVAGQISPPVDIAIQ